jgi:large subunit ribosomal protein L25
VRALVCNAAACPGPARGPRASISRRRQILRTKGVTTVPEVRIAAEPRTEFGKGAARRTRRQGRVPAIIYGHGTETRHITLPGHDLMMALKTPNVLIRIDGLPGGNQLALPKAVQRHPIRGAVEHVDLIMVRRGEKVTVDVPVQVTGEVFPGGLLDQQLVQVAVEAEATNIPGALAVGVEGWEIGAAVHAGELTLPAGVTLVTDPEALVLHVLAAPTAEQLEAELGEVPAAEEAEEVPPVPEEAGGAPAAPEGQAQEPAEQSG